MSGPSRELLADAMLCDAVMLVLANRSGVGAAKDINYVSHRITLASCLHDLH